MDNCLSLGLNTVIAQVRPFGDALYRSSLFPWSHLCTGVQGKDPGFDPLDVLLTEAHARGLSLEAWVNPYRLRSSASMPPAIAENSLLNTHSEWVCTVNEGAYLNPAIPEAADYVVQGVAELVQNYAVDGIHFDDYFYPTTDPSIDAAQFAASGEADLTSGMMQSMPYMSSPGKAMPQSTTMISPPNSKTVMFLPMPSRPPTRPCGSGSVPRVTRTTTGTSSTPISPSG